MSTRETFLHPAQERDATADIEAIHALRKKFAAAYNANDAAALAAFYTDDAVLMFRCVRH